MIIGLVIKGSISLSFEKSHSIRNNNPLIADTIILNDLDILEVAKTHVQISNTDSQLFLTPSFQLIHKPECHFW